MTIYLVFTAENLYFLVMTDEKEIEKLPLSKRLSHVLEQLSLATANTEEENDKEEHK